MTKHTSQAIPPSKPHQNPSTPSPLPLLPNQTQKTQPQTKKESPHLMAKNALPSPLSIPKGTPIRRVTAKRRFLTVDTPLPSNGPYSNSRTASIHVTLASANQNFLPPSLSYYKNSPVAFSLSQSSPPLSVSLIIVAHTQALSLCLCAPMAAATVKKARSPSSHPPFFEMVTDAIVTLKERTGSSQYAIQKFAEEKHKKLPANFRKLLLVQLRRFVASGKLVKVKNSFKLAPAAAVATAAKPKAKPSAAKPKPKTVAKPKAAAPKAKASAAAAKPKASAKPKAAAGTKRKAAEKPKLKPAPAKAAKTSAKATPQKKAVKKVAAAKPKKTPMKMKRLSSVKMPSALKKAKK